jgi:hypothetical protein
MDGNDPLDGCQADTGSWKLANGMQALKDTKQFVGISHIKADAVVAYVKCPFPGM